VYVAVPVAAALKVSGKLPLAGYMERVPAVPERPRVGVTVQAEAVVLEVLGIAPAEGALVAFVPPWAIVAFASELTTPATVTVARPAVAVPPLITRSLVLNVCTALYVCARFSSAMVPVFAGKVAVTVPSAPVVGARETEPEVALYIVTVPTA